MSSLLWRDNLMFKVIEERTR